MRSNLFVMFLFAALSLSMTGCWCDGSCHGDWDDDWYNGWEEDCWYDSWHDVWVCDEYYFDGPGGCHHGSCHPDREPGNNNPGGIVERDPDKQDPADPVACVWNSDCGMNAYCNHGVCVSGVDTPIQPECFSNSDCSDDMMCTEGRCIPCQTDACDVSKEIECVFSSQCESGLCVDGACLAPGACAIDANCSDGQICLDGACIARPECLSNSECPAGKFCNASNACEDDVECRVDADCGPGLLCLSNMCAQCRLNCECPNAGDICMNGACVAG